MKFHIAFLGLILLGSCNGSDSSWESLFNGKDLSGWHVYGPSQNLNGWHVKDQVLVFDPELRTEPDRVELVTDTQYSNFELSLEWKTGHRQVQISVFNNQYPIISLT